MTNTHLPDLWRRRAELLEPYSESAARAFRQNADELEKWLAEWTEELLSLEQAVQESGYIRDTLVRFVRDGKLTNFGSETDLRVRRCDLPRKLGYGHLLPRTVPEDIPAVASARRPELSPRLQAVRAVMGKR